MIGGVHVFVEEIDGLFHLAKSCGDRLAKNCGLADARPLLESLRTGREGTRQLDVEGSVFGAHVSWQVVFWLKL